MSETKQARTRRGEGFAGEGAQRQDGSLPIYICNTCGKEVVWAESRRTGRKYLVSVQRGYKGQRFYAKSAPHPRDCGERMQAEIDRIEAEEARIEAARQSLADLRFALRMAAALSGMQARRIDR